MRYRPNRRERLIRLLVLILSLGVVIYTLIYHSPLQNFSKVPTADSLVAVDNQPKANSLKEIVQNVLVGTKGSYGIVIKNLKTGESYYANEHTVYQSGSLYKLWVMAAAFTQIQSGELKESEVLSEDVRVLNDEFNISSDSAELTDGTITLTVSSALEKMITISHNYDALLLALRLKLSYLADFLSKNGFKESKIGTNGEVPTSSAYDTALFFEKLYKGELANQEYTNRMLDLLKAQQLNDKLPKYLPEETIIAHKTGELDAFTHDAGIIFTPKGDYIIVILSESDTPSAAEERIAQLSKDVYDFFQNK